MRSTLFSLVFASAGSCALFPRHRYEGQCCFKLHTYGGAEGTVGQLYDGQNRIGGHYEPAVYCIRGDAIYDSEGRGCILTGPTGQWQCDEGAERKWTKELPIQVAVANNSITAAHGVSIRRDGVVGYHGETEFWACPAKQGVWNIYNR